MHIKPTGVPSDTGPGGWVPAHRLTAAVPSVRNFQLGVFALGTLELAAGQEGPSVGRAERSLRGAPAVQAAVFVFILIDSQELREKGKKPDKCKETFSAANTRRPKAASCQGTTARNIGKPLKILFFFFKCRHLLV